MSERANDQLVARLINAVSERKKRTGTVGEGQLSEVILAMADLIDVLETRIAALEGLLEREEDKEPWI